LLVARGVADELMANVQRRTLHLRGQEEPLTVFIRKM